ncbi:phosphate acyltransferase [Azorhizobium oxalatiphilum]|uniref:Phosphate acyltransferase n=1 Tax=Azorhizobium oxalatiphilum TaxID=980631 RepID=A0A917BVQ5_9HYPH|nr:phosphate acyltransferase PlsX [Azorhizobium oxalatiphilum]GGF60171.1 phosphate acyltransferase [Azorhizobium oxalatiphilum]
MSAPVRIAIDAMGGDHGPETILAGVEIARVRHPDAQFVLFGDEPRIKTILARYPALAAASRIVHTDIVVGMDDKPSQALRRGRYRSSMWRSIDAVKQHEADAAVSAGNTGALMAMAKVNLRTMPGIDRPAIAGIWPTLRGESIVLDIGASIGATARSLIEMSIMGSAMARSIFDIESPTVGLLNVGTEEIKGAEEVKEAGRILREEGVADVNYHGFVEGNDIGAGTVDVVVTEGFTGNIALKTAEGTAKQLASYLRAAMGRSLRARIGYLFARDAFNVLREKMDPRRSNGGVFLGLNGIVIKSHGGTDAEGFAYAVDLAYDMVRHHLLQRIEKSIVSRLPATASRGVESAEAEGQS